jgi:peptidoglycan/LPS O-acetylase OafA/YrhL
MGPLCTHEKLSKPAKRIVYNPTLDGIRGVGVILVILCHANVFKGGYIGVDLFFVLSGYLISGLLLDEMDTAHTLNFKYFYMRRILRLVPALVAMISVVTIAMTLVSSQKLYNLIDGLISLFYLSDITRALNMNRPNWLAHTWSLAVEEQFYLLWPITLLYLYRRWGRSPRVGVICLGVAAAVMIYRPVLHACGATFERLYYALDTRADGLMIGAAIAVLAPFIPLKHTSMWKCISTLLLLLLIGFSACGNIFQDALCWYGFSLISIGGGLLLLGLTQLPPFWLISLLRMKWLVWIGRISYGLYLWHAPLMSYLLLERHMKAWQIALIGIPVSFALAIISYYLIEIPFLRLKKRYRGGRSAQQEQAIVDPSLA